MPSSAVCSKHAIIMQSAHNTLSSAVCSKHAMIMQSAQNIPSSWSLLKTCHHPAVCSKHAIILQSAQNMSSSCSLLKMCYHHALCSKCAVIMQVCSKCPIVVQSTLVVQSAQNMLYCADCSKYTIIIMLSAQNMLSKVSSCSLLKTCYQ